MHCLNVMNNHVTRLNIKRHDVIFVRLRFNVRTPLFRRGAKRRLRNEYIRRIGFTPFVRAANILHRAAFLGHWIQSDPDDDALLPIYLKIGKVLMKCRFLARMRGFDKRRILPEIQVAGPKQITDQFRQP